MPENPTMTDHTLPRSAIVGFDSSGRADAAVHAALDLRARFDTRVEVLHAVDIPPQEDVAGRPDHVALMRAEILARAWDTCSSHLSVILDHAGVEGLTPDEVLQVTAGHPPHLLVQRAESIGANLIVLGAHERRGHFDFGSTARAVLGKASCNVWIQPSEFHPIERILAPVDLSEESLIALRTARDMAQGYSARLEVLHCYDSPVFAYATGMSHDGFAAPECVLDGDRDAAEERFRRALDEIEWRGVPRELTFLEGLPADSILARQSSCDLIVMGSHGRTGLSAAVLGNVAYEVMKKSEKPVLAIRHPNRGWLL